MSKVSTDKQLIEKFLSRGVENVYPKADFVQAQLASGKRLTMYLGIDPTGPTLHLGHAIALMKLREWQELGHRVILLIGSFTGMIGDPTDKAATRQPLTKADVLENSKKYQTQAATFLRFDGDNPAEVVFNHEWLEKLSFADVVGIASHFTVQQMLERDMFEKRLEEGKPIHLHEFLYPLMQGYDSVALDTDGEIGGNDQTFNMLAGRDLMRSMKNKEKFIITMKLLVDPTGKKMGKSEGNMITMEDGPNDMYGKIMSWPDELIVPAFDICTRVETGEIEELKQAIQAGANPRDAKMRLAREIVMIYHGADKAAEAEEYFVKTIQNKEMPDEVEERIVPSSPISIIDALVETGLAPSKSEARRLVEQGGVKAGGTVITSVEEMIAVPAEGVVVQKGKHTFVRLIRK